MIHFYILLTAVKVERKRLFSLFEFSVFVLEKEIHVEIQIEMNLFNGKNSPYKGT